MTHPRPPWVLACAVCALAGCDRPIPEPAAELLTTEYTIVRSVSFDSIGTDARDVVPGRNGTFWVLTDHEPFLTELDASGRVLRRFGTRGRGPSDLLAPWSLVLDRSDSTIWTFDAGRHALLKVESLDKVPVAIPLRVASGPIRDDIRRVSHGDIANVMKIKEGIVAQAFPGELSIGRHLLHVSIVKYANDGARERAIVDFRATPPDTAGIASARVLVPVPLWIGCSDEAMFVYDGYSGAVEQLALDGSRHTIGRVTPVGVRSTDEDYRAYMIGQLHDEYGSAKSEAEILDLANTLVKQERARVSQILPAVSRLRCGPRGGVLIQRFNLAHHNVGYSRDWLLLVPPETGPRSLRLPAGFDPRLAIGDTLVGLLQDEAGAVSLAFAVESRDSVAVSPPNQRRSP